MLSDTSRRGFLSILSATGLAGCGSRLPDVGQANPIQPVRGSNAWPTTGADARNTRANPAAPGPRDGVGSRTEYDSFLSGSIAVVDGTLYGERADRIQAVSIADGSVAWRGPKSASASSLLATENFVVGSGLTPVALDRKSGDERWQLGQKKNDRVEYGPDAFAVGGDGTLFGGDGAGSAYATRDGTYRWFQDHNWTDARNRVDVAVGNGRFVRVSRMRVEGQKKGERLEYSHSTVEGFSFGGTRQFRRGFSGSLLPPVISQGNLYLPLEIQKVKIPKQNTHVYGTELGAIIVMDIEEGSIVTRRHFGDDPPIALAIADGEPITVMGNQIRRTDSELGETHWTTTTDEPVPFLLVGEDSLYTITQTRKKPSTVRCLDPASGEHRWSTTVECTWILDAALVGDSLYLSRSEPDGVIALRP